MNSLIKKACLLLSVVMLVNTGFPTWVYAEELQGTEMTGPVNEDTEDITEVSEISTEGADVTTEEPELMSEEVEYEIQNISIESDVVRVGDIQIIKIQLNNTRNIDGATIYGIAENRGTKVEYTAAEISDTDIIFEISYNYDQEDCYSFDSIVIETAEGQHEIELTLYREALSYYVISEEEGYNVDNGISFFSVDRFTGKYGNDGRFVIVLDPGHDPGCTDRGVVNGVWEPDLNWRMALAMKEELEKYSGVEVYINRTWEECPGLVDTGDDFDCLEMRVARAEAVQADLFISLHNNAAGKGDLQTSAHGSVIFISKYESYFSESKALAETVLDKLSELGLYKRGIFVKDYGDDGDFYDDGNSWDYYAVNRHSTLKGIPSLLIEHAFMDNEIDLAFLRDDAMVDAIGRADAQAIVDYYGLQMDDTVSGNMNITVDEDGYLNITIDNVKAPYGIRKVYVPVWSEENGQDDLIWYEADYDKGTWKVTVDLQRHNMVSGKYNAHLYYLSSDGTHYLIDEKNTMVDIEQESGLEISVADLNPATGDFTVQILNLRVPYEIGEVVVPIWSDANGQDDIVWYDAEKDGNAWIVKVKGANHKYTSGNYQIHLYIEDVFGNMHGITSTSAEITIEDQNKEKGVLVVTNQQDNGDFTVEIENVRAPYDISTIYVPIWSQNGGQDDLAWYQATKQNGIWKVAVDVGNHKMDAGVYEIHLYYVDSSGTMHMISSTTANVDVSEALKMKVSIINQDNERGKFTVEMNNFYPSYEVSKVYMPVWSNVNGQDDLVWYTADKTGSGKWSVDVEALDHNNSKGKYNVHVYAVKQDGSMQMIWETSTNVEFDEDKVKATELVVIEQSNGRFIVNVNNVNALANIKNIRIPIWSEENGQDDLRWYTAKWNGDQAVLTVDIDNHGNSKGIYNIHLYYEDVDGGLHYKDAMTVSID